MPDGLRAPPYTGSADQAEAVSRLLERSGSLVGDIDEETAIWVRMNPKSFFFPFVGGLVLPSLPKLFRSPPSTSLPPHQFLRDRKFDVDNAIAKLTKYLAWRSRVRPHLLSPSDISEEAATGKAFLHSRRDSLGRPAVVIRCAKHVIGEFPHESSVRLASYVLEKAVAELKQEDGSGSENESERERSVSPLSTSSSSSSSALASSSSSSSSSSLETAETLLGIFDLRGFGPRNADLSFARFLVDACFLYYPRRLGAVLFVDAPWAFKPVWAVVKPLLRKYGALVRFVSAKEVKEVYFAEGEAPPGF